MNEINHENTKSHATIREDNAVETGEQKPWYRHQWPWILMGLPFTVVVASFITYFIAIKGLDPVISKDYYKDGLAVNADLSLDQRAASLGLVGHIELENGQVLLRLSAKDEQSMRELQGQPLKLELENLSFQAANVNAILVPNGNANAKGQWHGQLDGPLRQSTWRARLIGPDWRISARLDNVLPRALNLKP